jgi:hypothetical protein
MDTKPGKGGALRPRTERPGGRILSCALVETPLALVPIRWFPAGLSLPYEKMLEAILSGREVL